MVILIAFFDICGLIFYAVITEDQTVYKEQYFAVLNHSHEKIGQNRPDLWNNYS